MLLESSIPELEALRICVERLQETLRDIGQILQAIDAESMGESPRDPDPDWIPVIHRFDRIPGWACQQPALYLTERPSQHRRADRAIMRVKPPGTSIWRTPEIDDQPRCSSCGRLIHPSSSVDLDYLSIMAPTPPQTPLIPRTPPPSPTMPETDHEMLEFLDRIASDLGANSTQIPE